MKQLVILSGKGGTGKTSVAASLAHLASQELNLVLADADVDASNLDLVLDPTRRETHDFAGGKGAVIDPAACTACGICAGVCRFEAIVPGEAAYRVDDLACEGCATCFYQCPVEAIRMAVRQDGEWFRSRTRFGPLFHAHLFAGRENSGKLVTQVRQAARALAQERAVDLILVDGPPGIGCPVIAACTGMDLALLVVEPTVSGVHDLERILATTTHFGVPAMVAINKADLNVDHSERIIAYCRDEGIPVAGRVPYDTVVTEAMVQGQPVTTYGAGEVAQAMVALWQRVKERVLA